MVKWHGLVRDDNLLYKLKTLGNFKIWMYQCHDIVLQAWDKHGHQAMMIVSIINANFSGCNLILEISWLQAARPTIKWKDENLIFPGSDGKILMRTKPKKVQKPKVNARRKSSYSFADTQPPDIAVVSLEELATVCETKGFNAFMMD